MARLTIAAAHWPAGYQLDAKHPAIADVLAGIRRVRGAALRRAAPANIGIVRRNSPVLHRLNIAGGGLSRHGKS